MQVKKKETRNEIERPRSLRPFLTLWLAQFISLIGTDVTKFALRVWTYQQTHSVSSFAFITFFSEAPAILLSPIAGAFVDRYSRKFIIVFSDSVSALTTLCLFLLFSSGYLHYWHIYLANLIGSLMNCLQWIAVTSSVPLLVPQDKITRFGGLNQTSHALSMLLSPMIAGMLVPLGSLQIIFAVEISTFLFGLLGTLSTPIPQPPKSAEGQVGKGSITSEIQTAWKFIQKRPALIALLFFVANGHFTSGLVQMLLTPLILSFADAPALGKVLTVSGTGGLFGSILLVAWKGPERKIFGVLGCAFFQGIMLASCGFAHNENAVLMVAFFYMFFIPLVRVCREAIWQSKVPLDLQGRILALQKSLAEWSIPTSAVVAGPLADLVFEPFLANEKSPLAPVFGPILGVGPGRGIALLFVILGVCYSAVSLFGLFYSPLRRVDLDLPDQTNTSKNN